MIAHAYPQFRPFAWRILPRDRALDITHDRIGLVGTAVNDQPARAFRNPYPHHEHDEPEDGAGEIGDPPPVIDSEPVRIEQDDRARRAKCGPDPEAAVDDEVGPTTIARRHQFLNGGIDGGVFAADAGSGQEPKQRITRNAP